MYMNFCKFLVIISLFFNKAFADDSKKTDALYINNSKKEMIKFDVEIANTQDKKEKGLMYRTSLPEDEGMLFLFKKAKIVNMWMKNTYIPLDILFIDKNGVIKKIVENTTPHSLKSHSSDARVVAALEINAMLSDKHSIKINDVVLHPFFNNIEDINVNRENSR